MTEDVCEVLTERGCLTMMNWGLFYVEPLPRDAPEKISLKSRTFGLMLESKWSITSEKDDKCSDFNI